MWRGRFALKFFAQNSWKENVTKYLCYFKFLVQDHLHEHFCTLEPFCVVLGFVCVSLIIKREPLVGETLIEMESAVAKQTKKVHFFFLLKHSASDNFLLPSKGYLKTHFEFSFEINTNFLYLARNSRIYDLLPTLLLFCRMSRISSNSRQPLISLCF